MKRLTPCLLRSERAFSDLKKGAGIFSIFIFCRSFSLEGIRLGLKMASMIFSITSLSAKASVRPSMTLPIPVNFPGTNSRASIKTLELLISI